MIYFESWLFHLGRSERECVKNYEGLKGRTNKLKNAAKGMVSTGKCWDKLLLAKQLREQGVVG